MNRVTFLIDGFNVYHSTIDLRRLLGYSTKWLDLAALCKSYTHLFGKDARVESIHYFSAIADYLSPLNPGKVQRHRDYIACLESTGVQVELARFKEKYVFCDKCRNLILKHEEKETDVTLAIKVVELFIRNTCDAAVIVSGDTDLAPAIRKCTSLFPGKKIIFAFPFRRQNRELASLAPESFSIHPKQYIRHQLPNPVILANGKQIIKPASW